MYRAYSLTLAVRTGISIQNCYDVINDLHTADFDHRGVVLCRQFWLSSSYVLTYMQGNVS